MYYINKNLSKEYRERRVATFEHLGDTGVRVLLIVPVSTITLRYLKLSYVKCEGSNLSGNGNVQ